MCARNLRHNSFASLSTSSCIVVSDEVRKPTVRKFHLQPKIKLSLFLMSLLVAMSALKIIHDRTADGQKDGRAFLNFLMWKINMSKSIWMCVCVSIFGGNQCICLFTLPLLTPCQTSQWCYKTSDVTNFSSMTLAHKTSRNIDKLVTKFVQETRHTSIHTGTQHHATHQRPARPTTTTHFAKNHLSKWSRVCNDCVHVCGMKEPQDVWLTVR